MSEIRRLVRVLPRSLALRVTKALTRAGDAEGGLVGDLLARELLEEQRSLEGPEAD